MNNVIEIRNLSKVIQEKKIVNDVSISIGEGSIYGLLGANGAGKTSLMKCILNIIKPTEGNINLLGVNINERNHPILKSVGSLIEIPVFYDNLTAYENLVIHCKYIDKCFIKDIYEVLDMVGLRDVSNKKVREFSLGMKQRLGIARALVTKPKILILDEPINGLDPMGIIDVRNMLISLNKKNGTTILISSHIIGEVEKIATHVGIMSEGRIIKEVKMNEINSDSLEEYFKSILLNAIT